jgi:hypothetical protein
MLGTSNLGRSLRQTFAILLASFAIALPARAASVLFFADLQHSDYVTPALAAGGHTVTTATDWTDFNTKLTSGSYNLVIALNQNSGLGANLASLTNYVNTGGRVIFTDWTKTASFGTLFQGSYTGNDNQTSLNFSAPALAAGITNPQPLTNPGWGIFSMGEAPAGGGASLCAFPNGNSCVVSGYGGRTLLLGFLSDTPSAADGVRLWQNLIGYALNAQAAAQVVPTMSEWGLLALALVLATVAGLRLRRHA